MTKDQLTAMAEARAQNYWHECCRNGFISPDEAKKGFLAGAAAVQAELDRERERSRKLVEALLAYTDLSVTTDKPAKILVHHLMFTFEHSEERVDLGSVARDALAKYSGNALFTENTATGNAITASVCSMAREALEKWRGK